MATISKRISGLIPGKEYILGVRVKNPAIGSLSDASEIIRFQVPSDQTIPGTLTNLQILSGLENIMFIFDNSEELDIDKYQYELYENQNMSDTGGPLTGFADANVFTVRVSNLRSESEGIGVRPFWGRVRGVDTSGNYGPWTTLIQSDAHTPLIDNQYIVSLTADKITAGTIGAHTINLNGANSIIQSSTYEDTGGDAGWQIRGDGHFSLGGPNGITYNNSTITIGSDVQVQANFAADSISVGSGGNQLNINGSINSGGGGMTLGDPTYNYWYANGNFRVGGATNYVLWNGTTLTIGGGSISGLTISSTKLYYGTGTYNNSNTNFYVDNTGQFSLGNKLSWNGTSLTVRGTLQFSDGSTPGTFDNGDPITGGTIGGITIASDKIYIGTGTYNNSNTAFYVDNTGKLSLKDKFVWDGSNLTINGSGTFTGQITAASGQIGGWNIGTASGFAGSIYVQNGSDLSLMSPTGLAWFSSGVVTTSISGFNSGVSTGGGALTSRFLRNIQYGGTKPANPNLGDIYFS